MIKLCIKNFWPDFNYDENIFISLFSELYGNELIVTNNVFDCNLCIVAENYVPQEIDRNKTKILACMPEPKEVQYSSADYHLSFDPDRFDLNNIRFPLWHYYINYYNLKNQKNPIPVLAPDELENNVWYNKTKNNFCAAPFSSLRNNRIEFYNLLNSYKSTMGFGLPFNNGDEQRSELRKYEVISEFRFVMAFENTHKKGYVTEKLFHAKTSGAIPIYWGDEYCLCDFNPESFIYVNNFNSMQDCLEYIKYIDQNEELYQKMHKAPLFRYDVNDCFDNIKKRLKQMISI